MKKRAALRRLGAALVFLGLLLGSSPLVSQSPAVAKPRLGATVPLDLRFLDENGAVLRLGDLMNRPTVLLFDRVTTQGEDHSLLDSLAAALGSLHLRPGVDYRVIAVESGTAVSPARSAARKAAALAAIGMTYPAGEWRWLVSETHGPADSASLLASATGLVGEGAASAVPPAPVILILSSRGRILHYMPGSVVVPLDLGINLMSASPSVLRRAAASVLRFCLVYDEVNQHFVLDILRLSGMVIFVLAAALGLYLLLSSGQRRDRASPGVER